MTRSTCACLDPLQSPFSRSNSSHLGKSPSGVPTDSDTAPLRDSTRSSPTSSRLYTFDRSEARARVVATLPPIVPAAELISKRISPWQNRAGADLGLISQGPSRPATATVLQRSIRPTVVARASSVLPTPHSSISTVAKTAGQSSMTTWEEAHNKPERSQYDQAQRPRASSGLNVADLLSSPPPMKRPKAKSLEGSHSSQPLFAHSPSKAGFGGTPTGTLPPSSGREAGPSKPSSPVSGSQSPSSRSHGAVTPSKSSRLVGGLPSSAVTIDSPPEAPAYQYASAQQILEGRENM